MDDRVKISLLVDYYGLLLTDKQYKIMQLYYDEDLSLAEIAELNHTSRQAIHDLIKRCYKILLSYESKLKLLQKSINHEEKIDDFLKYIKSNFLVDEDKLQEMVKKIKEL